MNIVNDILVNTLFPDTDFVQTLEMNSVVPKYVENQEKGNPSVCKNCAEAPFKDLHIYGRSEQMTTTGAQLLDASKLRKNNCTIKIEEQGRKITITGRGAYSGARIETADIGMFSDGIGKQIFISEKATVLSGNAIVVVALSYVLDGVTSYITMGGGGFVTKIIPDGATLQTLQINVNHSNEALDEDTTVVFEDLIVGIGSAALPFEPYTGGKPSPSPDYPQEIRSAGEGGSVTVKVTGRNILDMRNSKESVANSGVTYTRNADYSFTRTGTATEVSGNVWMAGGYLVKPKADLSNVFCVLLKGVKYSIKDCVLLTVSPAGNVLAARNENFVPTQDMYITGARNENFIVGETYNDIVYPAVYVGEKALQYEPYREQLLTIPTPNGLPGIPVTSGGNYTDENGQQWICDEVNLERGVYVQRVDKGAFDATKALTEQSVILATPIETPLTAAEIAAYKSLRTYRGTTIVEAEDKAGISVKYNMPMPKLSKNGALRRWFKRHPII